MVKVILVSEGKKVADLTSSHLRAAHRTVGPASAPGMPHLLAAISTRRRRRKKRKRVARRRRVARKRKRVARKTARRRVRRKSQKKKMTQPCQQAKRGQCFCSEGWSVSTFHTVDSTVHTHCKSGNNLTSGWNL